MTDASTDRSAVVAASGTHSTRTPTMNVSLPAPAWATLVATFFGIGRMRPGPGTWGSAATVLLWSAIAHALSPSLRTSATIVSAMFVILIGIPAATRVARANASKDPQFVVIDEVAGRFAFPRLELYVRQ